jgi:hypothetical protein
MGTAELRQAYTEFFKTDDGRAFARSFGKSIPINSRYARHNLDFFARLLRGEADIDFCDPADLPRASVMDDPIDHIEPLQNSCCLDGITQDEIKRATAIFESSMRWCIDGVELVQMGRRAEIVISIMKPDLGYGLNPNKNAVQIFIAAHPNANGDFALSGRLFGPVLEWLRRGHRGSELGERIMVLFYVLRPDLISNSTLASLGRISNKTRQAKDKLANCLRDHFSGIKARAMRGDMTRIRCRNSQLARV